MAVRVTPVCVCVCVCVFPGAHLSWNCSPPKQEMPRLVKFENNKFSADQVREDICLANPVRSAKLLI